MNEQGLPHGFVCTVLLMNSEHKTDYHEGRRKYEGGPGRDETEISRVNFGKPCCESDETHEKVLLLLRISKDEPPLSRHLLEAVIGNEHVEDEKHAREEEECRPQISLPAMLEITRRF